MIYLLFAVVLVSFFVCFVRSMLIETKKNEAADAEYFTRLIIAEEDPWAYQVINCNPDLSRARLAFWDLFRSMKNERCDVEIVLSNQKIRNVRKMKIIRRKVLFFCRINNGNVTHCLAIGPELSDGDYAHSSMMGDLNQKGYFQNPKMLNAEMSIIANTLMDGGAHLILDDNGEYTLKYRSSEFGQSYVLAHNERSVNGWSELLGRRLNVEIQTATEFDVVQAYRKRLVNLKN